MRPPTGPPAQFDTPDKLSESAPRRANRLDGSAAAPPATHRRSARHRWQESVRERPRVEVSPQQIEAQRIRVEAQRIRVEAQEARDEARLKKCPPAHWGLTCISIFLAVISIPLIYSASTSDAFLLRQMMFVGIGLTVMFVASRLAPQQMPRLAQWLYGACIVGLIFTKWGPLGHADLQGIQRWLKLGPLTFQVSEVAKIALIGVVAHYWSHLMPRERRSFQPWLVGWIIALPLVGLVFLQPHLSAAMLLLLLPCGMAFFAGAPWQRMAQIFGGMAAVAALVVALCVAGKCPGLKDYQQERIRAFVVRHSDDNSAKKKDFQDANYQADQGMNALRRGGLLGAGPGMSFYKHGHVPEPHTDFIFAIIGEEWGLLGTMILLSAFGALIFFCFQIGHNAATSFEALFCAGVGSLLALQVVANTGVVTGLLPVTGVVLPLLSYGGSGLIVMLFAIGQVLGISRHQCGNEE